ncbi:crossover junction endodeoxyribonuclease RuvC [Fodinibius salsisoli]|uniref:Crossover junction endodeoxyribonuclease RuvC n=1 Tax=Fodinibius salsisoli TaxID=2820877 RepID=A0ABT3PIK3_9BACT|nr:crossover junction endodeoxyribonuclease RuvC [Fodinibius salsisoli]MCW9705752.1 crossover junction endodeoxyribonuclease RuvC [Fodinibius salsisoli]
MADNILGIDPGSRTTGYAILTKQDGKLVAMRCDTITMAHMDDHSERLQHIFEKISGIIASFNPTSCAVETPIYGVDPLAMLKLGRAQAAAMLAITNSDIGVTEYYPKQVKKSITGNGNASKEQVAFMLRKTVRLPKEKLSKDATDALAVAWCHLMKQDSVLSQTPASKKKTHQNNSKSSWESFVANNPDRIRS